MTFKEKLLTSQPPIEVAGRRFKRYYVTSETAPVTADIERAATELLPKLAPDADGTPPAGFIVVHRAGDGAAYLNAYTWVWDNALHMRGAAGAPPSPNSPARTTTRRTSSCSTGRGSAASGSSRPSTTSATPGCGTSSCPTPPTWMVTWPTRCRRDTRDERR